MKGLLNLYAVPGSGRVLRSSEGLRVDVTYYLRTFVRNVSIFD